MVMPQGRIPASLAATLDAGDRGVIVRPLARTEVRGVTTGAVTNKNEIPYNPSYNNIQIV
jgi:hypothetical protein